MIKQIEILYDCKAERLYKFCHMDFAMTRNDELVALVEVKCRNVPVDKYDTTIIPVQKRIDACLMAEILNIPVFFIFGFTDGIRYIPHDQDPDFAAIGKRQDRDDPNDQDIWLHYKTEKLKVVK